MAAQDERPEGPLAVSHRTGKRRNWDGNPRRFDALWISPDLRVVAVAYEYARAFEAGSDHALVVAELCVEVTVGRPGR